MLTRSHTPAKVVFMPKPFDPREQAVQGDSITRAIRDAQRERAEFTRKTGVPVREDGQMVIGMPMRASRLPLSTRVSAADWVDQGVERYGRAAIVRALLAVCAANGIDIVNRTLDELAACEEEQ